MDKFVKAEDVKDLLNGLDSLPWEDEVEDMVDRLVDDDIVKIIRCKDCESFISRNGTSWCEEHSDGWGDHTVYVDEEDFCSYGARKTD